MRRFPCEALLLVQSGISLRWKASYVRAVSLRLDPAASPSRARTPLLRARSARAVRRALDLRGGRMFLVALERRRCCQDREIDFGSGRHDVPPLRRDTTIVAPLRGEVTPNRTRALRRALRRLRGPDPSQRRTPDRPLSIPHPQGPLNATLDTPGQDNGGRFVSSWDCHGVSYAKQADEAGKMALFCHRSCRK